MGHKENREELDYYRRRQMPVADTATEPRGGSHKRKHGGLWLVHEHDWNGRKRSPMPNVTHHADNTPVCQPLEVVLGWYRGRIEQGQPVQGEPTPICQHCKKPVLEVMAK